MKIPFSFVATNEKGSYYILEFDVAHQGDVHVLLSCAMLEGQYVVSVKGDSVTKKNPSG